MSGMSPEHEYFVNSGACPTKLIQGAVGRECERPELSGDKSRWRSSPRGPLRLVYRLLRGTESGHCTDPDPKKQGLDLLITQADAALGHGVEPPVMALLHEFARTIALVFKLWLGQFLELSIGDDAGPVGLAADLIDLDADLRIAAHPLDFLSQGREHINVIPFVGNADWDDIRLIVQRATQPCDGGAGQDLAAFQVV